MIQNVARSDISRTPWRKWKKNFHQHDQLFPNYIAVTAFNPGQQAVFTQLHLRDNAPWFH